MGKLVRDGIPAMVGAGAVARVLDTDEYAAALRAKLNEEVAEYLEANDPQELADVLEVLHALAALHGLTAQDLEARRAAKAEARASSAGECGWSSRRWEVGGGLRCMLSGPYRALHAEKCIP